MSYHLQVVQLATSVGQAHGSLQEVIFLQAPNHSLLVFADGTVLPTFYTERGDRHWTAMVQEVKRYPYLDEVTRQLEGKSPWSLLRFGDHELGSEDLTIFLRTAGFKQTAVREINLPLKLRADGTQVRGAKRGEWIEWEDGSATPKVGRGNPKAAAASLSTSEVDQLSSPPQVKANTKFSQPISRPGSTTSDSVDAHRSSKPLRAITPSQARRGMGKRLADFWKSGFTGKFTLGCGGLSGLLSLCLVSLLCTALLGSDAISQPVVADAVATQSADTLTTSSTVVAVTTTVRPKPTETAHPNSTPTLAPLPTSTLAPPTPAQIFDLVSPSVAFISTPAATGSGILIEDGFVVTNAHVVWPFQEVRVVFPDGSEYLHAPVLNWDLLSDLAIIGPLQTPIPPLALTDGEDSVIGSDVYLIGYPGESEQFPQPTLTRGLISRLREWETTQTTYFQTDALIAGGQSGGVLVSEKGEVVGISGFSFTEAGFGLVASAADILPRVQRLIAGDDVAGLGDRRVPLTGGQREHKLGLDYFWDQRMYVINEPMGTPIDIKVESENNAGFVLLDVYGEVLIGANEGEVRGVETGSMTTAGATPYFVILGGQFAESPGNVQVRSNYSLIPYDDVDDRARVSSGQKLLGSVDYPGDLDYFVIDLEAGDTVNLTVDSIMIDPVVVIHFLGATEEEIILDDNRGGGLFGLNAEVTYRASHNGSYFIAIADQSSLSFGGYFLTIN